MASIKTFQDNNNKKIEIIIRNIFTKNKKITLTRSNNNKIIILENNKKVFESNTKDIKTESDTSFISKHLSPFFSFVWSHKEYKLIISWWNQKYEIPVSKFRWFLKNLSLRESIRWNLNFRQTNYVINFLEIPNPFTKTEIYSRTIRTYFIRLSLIFIIIIIPLIIFFDIQNSSGLSLWKFLSILLGI